MYVCMYDCSYYGMCIIKKNQVPFLYLPPRCDSSKEALENTVANFADLIFAGQTSDTPQIFIKVMSLKVANQQRETPWDNQSFSFSSRIVCEEIVILELIIT